jgi:hypothetical protein
MGVEEAGKASSKKGISGAWKVELAHHVPPPVLLGHTPNLWEPWFPCQ